MEGFSIIPMPVGAEVCGLTSGHEEASDTCNRLYDAWLEYGFLLFRKVNSIDRHLAISRFFGNLEVHPVPEVRFKADPYLIELGVPMAGGRATPPAYVFDETDIRINRIAWHRDTAYTPDICKGAMLRMLEVPEHEGETMLADTAMAWDDLPGNMKRKLEGLEYKSTVRTNHLMTMGNPGIFWQKARAATEDEDPGNATKREALSGIDSRYPSVIQPAVLTHPESGRRCIFLSPTYVDFFIGLSTKESDDLLWHLTDHMLQPKYVYKHKWQTNDAIVWDNRRCIHAGMGNRPDEPRYGLRTTLSGPTRTGRYFDPEARAPELNAMTD